MKKIADFTKAHKVILSLSFIYIAFHSFFETYITDLLVNTFLSHLDSAWYNDCFAVVFFLINIYCFIRSLRLNRYISKQILVLSILFLIIIGYYRFIANIWIFTSMYVCEHIRYFDFLMLYCAINILTYCIFHCRKKPYPNEPAKGFIFDNPIKTEEDDKLNRKKLAKKIAEKINYTVNDRDAFTIGICSEWGAGKTSFLNLIEKNLENNPNRVIVHFNPWLNNDEVSVIIHFFDELSNKLKPYNKELSKDLIEYAEILNVTANTNIEKAINLFKTNHSKSLQGKFQSINQQIKNSGKQIVIFIDDTDRLYEKEVLEILRLIRNSANFANTVFIVAYDRNYLISALKKSNEYRPNFYLEKIFQLEIMLPTFEKNIIANKLREAIIPFLMEEDKKILEKNNLNYSLFSNIRDVNRFANSFLLSYEMLKGEVFLLDLLNLELLRIKYLGIYNLLSKDYNKFLKPAENHYSQYSHYGNICFCLKKLKDCDNEDKSNEKTLLEKYLENYYVDVGIQKSQIEDVIKYVNNIFTDYRYSVFPRLSICNPNAIDRYFYYRLLNSNLSEIEFSNFRQKEDNEFHNKIFEWVQNGLYHEVADRFERIEYFENKEDYEKIIYAIFFLASIPKPDNRDFGFNIDNLLSKMTYEKVKESYTEDEYKIFVRKLLNDQKPPYSFVSTFLDNIFHALEWKFILTEEELINQKQTYFKQYASDISSIDGNFFWLYGMCGYNEYERNGNHVTDKQIPPTQGSKDIFILCAERLIDSFLRNIIIRGPYKDIVFYIRPIVCEIWGTWEEFEKFLLKFDEQEVSSLKEFKDFYNKYKNAGFRDRIEYDFKEIKLSI